MHVTNLLSDRMRAGLVGRRLSETDDSGVEDCRLVISGGAIWLLARWLESDFKSENAPERIARRMANSMLLLSGVRED